MTKDRNESHYWSVILAGGDGQRLLPLTRLVSGDDRPKQFCPLLSGGKTLLEETRARTARFIRQERTVFVLNGLHEPFYIDELASVSPELMVVQPENRGTLPAILASLARIIEFDEQAIVGFFPCDHHYSREDTFVEGARRGFRAARLLSNSVILLGTTATHAEPGYGYIEPVGITRRRRRVLHPVSRFWEKPSLALAESLRQRGCLWNTFVMIGRASAFLDMIQAAVPDVYASFRQVLPPRPARLRQGLDTIYRSLQPSDFSNLVLASGCSGLCVLDVGETGWNDLGDPDRLSATLALDGVKSPWRELWARQASTSPG
jgi:mannose-1-phosphate guanylyltransferase